MVAIQRCIRLRINILQIYVVMSVSHTYIRKIYAFFCILKPASAVTHPHDRCQHLDEEHCDGL